MKSSSVFKVDIPPTMLSSNQLVKILILLKKSSFTIGVFINLLKAFGTVDHSILLEKMKLHGVADKNPAWFESYLSYRNHYIRISESNKADPKYVTCGVPQGFIFGLVLFLIHVNDLPNASHLFYPLLFINDINLFFDQKDMKHLFKSQIMSQ